MNRRSFVATTVGAPALAYAMADNREQALRCGADGHFKILMISDLHYRPAPDVHGLALTERLIDLEKPNLVIVTGDCMSGKECTTVEQVRTTIGHIASVMEKKNTPWAITFGNHDQEHFPKTNFGKDEVLAVYASYPHNLNGDYARGLHGGGNKHLLIWNAAGSKPVYCVWLIDSNMYFSDGKNNPYDWIHADQIHWYMRASAELEQRHGAKIPGLMFFHIPLPEFNELANHGKIVGMRQESEAVSPVNGGMFAAVVDRGDVRGIFCGHDHTNNYVGKWRGIELGYDGSLGHYTYPRVPPEDPSNGKVRGGRVFQITDGSPATHKSWMRTKDGTVNWESESDAYMNYQLK